MNHTELSRTDRTDADAQLKGSDSHYIDLNETQESLVALVQQMHGQLPVLVATRSLGGGERL